MFVARPEATNPCVMSLCLLWFGDNWWFSWSWLYGSWICNCLCSQCLSPLKLWVRISLIVRCTRYNFMW